MATEPNPYRSPSATVRSEAKPQEGRKGVVTSLFMIFVGAFFFAVNVYVMLGNGVDALLSAYPSIGRFWFAFGVFYGLAGGFTSLFHVSYLLRGRPKQHLAGIYAIAVALCLAGVAVSVMEVMQD